MQCIMGWLVIGALTLASPVQDDKQTEKQRQLAQRAKKYEYTGTKPFVDYNIGTAYQSVVNTADDLAEVDAWYRRLLGVQPGEGTGVSSRTVIVDRDTPKERGFEVRRVLYGNDRKPRDTDSRQTEPQKPTVRSYIMKEEGYTVVVVAARSADDKATQISVSVLPNAAE